MKEAATTDKVTRLEVIDHTPCTVCGGSGLFPNTFGGLPCKNCKGYGFPGREVIAWDKNKKIDLELQDEGRTLKIFITERES